MPNISAKELTALEDHLGNEQNLTSKYQFYAEQCEDKELKKKFQKISQTHQGHFDALTPYLNN